MRGLLVCISVALIVTMAAAQPWQWEEYGGNFWNPSNFSIYSIGVACGDFDGDQDEELISLSSTGFMLTVRDTDSSLYYWDRFWGTEPSASYAPSAAIAYDLNHDNRDEYLLIIADTIQVWCQQSIDPVTWVRCDDLFAGFPKSFMPLDIEIADIDADGLMNAVYIASDTSQEQQIGTSLEIYEETGTGGWELDTVIHRIEFEYDFQNIFAADFDVDGDIDFSAYGEDWDVFVSRSYLNMGGSFAEVQCWECMGWNAAGNLDDDPYDEYVGTTRVIAQIDPNASGLPRFGPALDLTSFYGWILGSFQWDGQSHVVGMQNHVDDLIWNPQTSFYPMTRSDLRWMHAPIGLSGGGYAHNYGSTGDLDGDGKREVLQHAVGGFGWPWLPPRDYLWRNSGNDSADYFPWQSRIELTMFSAHDDSVFESLQLGDLNGDGRAEIGCIVSGAEQPKRVAFYELIGALADTSFVMRPEFSDGLTDTFRTIRMGDIDNDNQAEMIGIVDSVWQAWFYRNGVWERYDNILPDLQGSDFGLADFEDDGDLDIFTLTQVWLNLSPSAIDRGVQFVPSAISLTAYPNPFNSGTRIGFELPRVGVVTLEIYNVLGERVRTLMNGKVAAGAHEVSFDGSELPSGIYFAHFRAVGTQLTQKLLLVK